MRTLVRTVGNMDLDYCNGQERCSLRFGKYIDDFSPLAFRRGYVAALFACDARWLRKIEKYDMIICHEYEDTTLTMIFNRMPELEFKSFQRRHLRTTYGYCR